MNFRLLIAIGLLFAAPLFTNLTQGALSAQTLGSHYFWANSYTVSGTSIDQYFSDPWEYCSIYADTVDVLLRIGAPDTTSWSSRTWIYLPSGSTIEFSPFIKLRRIEAKTVSGTGTLYIVGFKRKPQF